MTRYDSAGMFWEDVYEVKSARVLTRPPIPDNGWCVPKTLPNLSAAKMICVDVETNDTGLAASMGPGQYRGDGFIAGLAVGTDDGHRWYFPMRHEGDETNLDADKVLLWAKDNLCDASQEKIGANIKYDLEWLASEGVNVAGRVHDILIAEPLIDETQIYYNLDALGAKYLGEGKVDKDLYEWCSRAFGGVPTRKKQAGNIWRAPAKVVGPYAESDVDLPFRIYEKQKIILEREELTELYDLECRLVPLLVAMRRHGVPIDIDAVPGIKEELGKKVQQCSDNIYNYTGFRANPDIKTDLVTAFTKAGIEYPLTDKGNPSFAKKVLENMRHPLADMILEARKYNKVKGTFIDGYMGHVIEGRIHSEFNQLKGDGFGSLARFSSSNPNLQNIPNRDKELKKYCRRLFIPDDGCQWRRYDYSQIEYRFYAHYGRGESAERVRAAYNDDPKTDFHITINELIKFVTGLVLERTPTKTINFGLGYGMSENTLAHELGIPIEEARVLFKAYHASVPFIKDLANRAASIASRRGYVKTILKRRGRFNMYVAKDWEMAQIDGEVSRQYAEGQYGEFGFKRAGLHKALSRVIQGSAADLMKKAMVEIWESGVCDIVGVPLLTVHDELGFSDPQTKESEAAFLEIKKIMEGAIKLKVPVIVEQEVGPNWGQLTKLEI